MNKIVGHLLIICLSYCWFYADITRLHYWQWFILNRANEVVGVGNFVNKIL